MLCSIKSSLNWFSSSLRMATKRSSAELRVGIGETSDTNVPQGHDYGMPKLIGDEIRQKVKV